MIKRVVDKNKVKKNPRIVLKKLIKILIAKGLITREDLK